MAWSYDGQEEIVSNYERVLSDSTWWKSTEGRELLSVVSVNFYNRNPHTWEMAVGKKMRLVKKDSPPGSGKPLQELE